MGANDASGQGLQYAAKNRRETNFHESYDELTPVLFYPKVPVFESHYFH